MYKIILLSTALAFIFSFPSYGMEAEEAYNPSSRNVSLKSLPNVTRLSTPQSHMQYLQEIIPSAMKSILITSHGGDKEAFESGNLYNLLADASNRGVKVYIYNIDSKDPDDETIRFFQEHGIFYDIAYTHAKLFAVDDKKVGIGSYNWLSKLNSWENATFCLSGKECKGLVPLLWEDLRYYRNRQFGNEIQVRQYKNNLQNQNVDTWDLDGSTKLYYFHTLKHHRDFIAEAFQVAKNSLVFCAPFINENSGYQEDFEWNLLSKTINRGVHICFACRAEDPYLPSFRNYLGTLLQSSFMHLIPLSGFHQKTGIIDDNTIIEGSFNLLSASRDEESEFHNHEVTLMLHGTQAKKFIQDFYTSSIGQAIVNATSIQNLRLNKSEELIKVVEPKPSSWQRRPKFSSRPNSFEVFSGDKYGIDGFCVRFDREDYLIDEEGEIIYFHTGKEAQQTALKLTSKKSNPLPWQGNRKLLSKPNSFEIFSGEKFGINGFCVRFNKKDYLVDEEGEIVYFRTEKEAQQAAYESQ